MEMELFTEIEHNCLLMNRVNQFGFVTRSKAFNDRNYWWNRSEETMWQLAETVVSKTSLKIEIARGLSEAKENQIIDKCITRLRE
jgi:hypothetical protein